PQENLTRPGRTYAEGWRLGCGILLALLMYLLGTMAYLAIGSALCGSGWIAPMAGVSETTPGQVLFVLGSFITMILAVLGAATLHRRKLSDLLGGYRRTFRAFIQTIIALAPIVAVLIAISLLFENLTPNVAPALWVMLLPLSLVLILIQVSAEELAFRGYLQSQLAAMNLPTWVWLVVPSVLFGAVHYDPETMGDLTWYVVIWAGVFGLCMADLTARTGTLGPAIALHFANNLIPFLFFGYPDYIGGSALYTLPYSVSDAGNLIVTTAYGLLTMAIMYLAIRIRLKV
ncbi:MAG: lysostaphin resistance A-like protein, partial [Planktomarina sp.]